jgi:tripartite ATP-independent transporter DctP family solute receptor
MRPVAAPVANPGGMTMRKVTRRSVITSAAGLTALATFNIARRAKAAEFSFKLGVDWPSDHPSSVQARVACDRVLKESNGRIDIKFFPDNALGGDTDMLSQLRHGALEFMFMPTGVLSTLIPVAAINNVGMAFDNYTQIWQAMDGSLGTYVRKEIGKVGLTALDKIWDNGFRQLTTCVKPIHDLKDVQGLKIRVPVSPIFVSMWKALGASPASANVNELYTALQTRIFDGQENALPHLQYYKLYEVQQYCALTAHMWEGFWLLANSRVWSGLPADVQTLISRVFAEEAINQRAALAKFAGSLQAQLEGEGMKFTTPDRQPFREALSKNGFYAEWKKEFGEEAWHLLEAATRPLA